MATGTSTATRIMVDKPSYLRLHNDAIEAAQAATDYRYQRDTCRAELKTWTSTGSPGGDNGQPNTWGDGAWLTVVLAGALVLAVVGLAVAGGRRLGADGAAGKLLAGDE